MKNRWYCISMILMGVILLLTTPSQAEQEEIPVLRPPESQLFFSTPDTSGLPPALQSVERPAPEAHPAKMIEKKVYKPVSAIAVFPILLHGQDKAFGDLAILFANEFCNKIALKVKGAQVLNPVYTIEELRMKGYGSVYDQLAAYYIHSGRPEPKALNYLLQQISSANAPIQRVFFIVADADLTEANEPHSLLDRFKAWTTDALPKEETFFIRSRIQAYDLEDPNQPLVWDYFWTGSVKATTSTTVSPSIFQDSVNLRAFSKASSAMGSYLITIMPPKAYSTETLVKKTVAGQVISATPIYKEKAQTNAAAENLPETGTAGNPLESKPLKTGNFFEKPQQLFNHFLRGEQ